MVTDAELEIDRGLLENAQRDKSCWGEICDRYYQDVLRFAWGYTKDEAAAWEIAQETFLAFFQCLPKLRWQDRPLSAWLFKVAKHRVYRQNRGFKDVVPLEALELLVDDGPDAFSQMIVSLDVAEAVQQLIPSQRDVIVKHYFEHMSLEEIAEQTGQKTNAIKQRLHRAREALRGKAQRIRGWALAPVSFLWRAIAAFSPAELTSQLIVTSGGGAAVSGVVIVALLLSPGGSGSKVDPTLSTAPSTSFAEAATDQASGASATPDRIGSVQSTVAASLEPTEDNHASADGLITYVCPAGICIRNLDGSGHQELALSLAEPAHASPTLSPDGRQVAFVDQRDESGNDDIYVASLSNGEIRRLTYSQAVDAYPSWSPDGSYIVFTSLRDGNLELYVMNPDGSGQTNLTNSRTIDLGGVWSPDGKQVAFLSNRDSALALNVYILDLAKGDVKRLNGDDSADFGLAWSPSGTELAYVVDTDIIVATVHGGDHRFLAPGEYPAWSRDGTTIAFSRGGKVYTIRPDGSGEMEVGPGTMPSWQSRVWIGPPISIELSTGSTPVSTPPLKPRLLEDVDGDGVPNQNDICPFLAHDNRRDTYEGDIVDGMMRNACDSDNDQFIDLVEFRYGSDALEHNSVPEADPPNFSSCSDNIDNDKDGWVDVSDSDFCGLDFSIGIDINAGLSDECGTGEGDEPICVIPNGSSFSVNVYLNSLPAAVPNYAGYDVFVSSDGGVEADLQEDGSPIWTSGDIFCDVSTARMVAADIDFGRDRVGMGCASLWDSLTGTGLIARFQYHCDGSGTIDLLFGEGNTAIVSRERLSYSEGSGAETLAIACGIDPTPTPSWLEFHLAIDVDGDAIDDCSTVGDATPTCAIPSGETFTAKVYLDGFAPLTGYVGASVSLKFRGVTSNGTASIESWSGCAKASAAPKRTGGLVGQMCLTDDTKLLTCTGLVLVSDFQCTSDGQIWIYHGASFPPAPTFLLSSEDERRSPPSELFGEEFGRRYNESGPDRLDIKCVPRDSIAMPADADQVAGTSTST